VEIRMTDTRPRLQDKVAVVAGGGRNIGAAVSRRLAREGAHVVVGDLAMEGAERTAAGIVEAGGSAVAHAFDAAEEASVASLMQRAVVEFGGLDLLHANAADTAASGRDEDLLSIDVELWNHILTTDLRGVFFCLRYAIPLMLQRGRGAIVCTASDIAFTSSVRQPAYGAAKAGVVSLSRHVAARWGKEGIRCNIVSPGLVPAEEHPPGRFTSPRDKALAAIYSQRLGVGDDIAGAVAYLLSDDAEWVQGQALSVNGGSPTVTH
jgi:NAD(P)-dependent dehydrogenase (short-subunit alcohol dehydrogenase family)